MVEAAATREEAAAEGAGCCTDCWRDNTWEEVVAAEAGMKPPAAAEEEVVGKDSEHDGDSEVHMEHGDVGVGNWNLEGLGGMKKWRDLHKHPNFDYCTDDSHLR